MGKQTGINSNSIHSLMFISTKKKDLHTWIGNNNNMARTELNLGNSAILLRNVEETVKWRPRHVHIKNIANEGNSYWTGNRKGVGFPLSLYEFKSLSSE